MGTLSTGIHREGAAINEAVADFLGASDQSLSQFELDLLVGTVSCLPRREYRSFTDSLSAASMILGEEARRAEVRKIVYDIVHEASFYMPRDDAARVVALLDHIPHPYPIQEMRETPELESAMERVGENITSGQTIKIDL